MKEWDIYYNKCNFIISFYEKLFYDWISSIEMTNSVETWKPVPDSSYLESISFMRKENKNILQIPVLHYNSLKGEGF